ncbi:MAG: DUF192 domain-containing protein [Cyanobacteria bacterium P01_A01_bin.114]
MFCETLSGALNSGKVGWKFPILGFLSGLCCLLLGCSTPLSASDPGSLPISPGPSPEISPETSQETLSETSESMLSGPGQLLPVTAQASIAGETIDLEVAETPEQQALGLMYRTELADNRGMLFPFEFPRRTAFWMKNVPISLDMIFLLRGEVQAISADTPPCTTEPCPIYGPDSTTLVDEVIELRGGRAAELGLQPGDRVVITPIEAPPGQPDLENTPTSSTPTSSPSNPSAP